MFQEKAFVLIGRAISLSCTIYGCEKVQNWLQKTFSLFSRVYEISEIINTFQGAGLILAGGHCPR